MVRPFQVVNKRCYLISNRFELFSNDFNEIVFDCNY